MQPAVAPPAELVVRFERRGRWPFMLYSQPGVEPRQSSYLRLSQTRGRDWYDMRSVCKIHDTCSFSVSCRQARPIGALWCWLVWGCNNPGCSREEHQAYKRQMTFANKQAARLEFLSLDGSDEWFAAEASVDGVDWEVEDDDE